MTRELTTISLYPGPLRAEAALAAGVFDLSNSESREFIGRAVAAVANVPYSLHLRGSVLVTAAVAQNYGFTGVDGQQPRPFTLTDA